MFRRLKNLWALSEYIPGSKEIEKNLRHGDKVAMIVKTEYRPATIVDMQPPVSLDEPLNENNETN